jgi:hypothetical protein
MSELTTNEERLRVANELASELSALLRRAKDANLDLTTASLEFSLSMLHRDRYKIKIVS